MTYWLECGAFLFLGQYIYVLGTKDSKKLLLLCLPYDGNKLYVYTPYNILIYGTYTIVRVLHKYVNRYNYNKNRV